MSSIHRLAVKAAVIAAAVCASAAANAQQAFDFTYSFADGQQVTGTFTGTTTDGGQSVTNISNLQVFLNGVGFAPVVSNGTTLGNTTLQVNNWNLTSGTFDNSPVTIYANGALNNWVISDVNAAVNTNPDYYFAYINDPVNGSYAIAANFLQTDSFSPGSTQLALDSPGNAANWSLTEAPLPAALPLLLSGLGLMGFAGRRRRAA